MEFSDIAQKRYATKSFDGRMVDAEKIERLMELIRLSCSSFNIQPWRIKVISDAATKQALLPSAWNQPQITTCSHLLVFCADTELEKRAKELYSLMRSSGVPEANVAGLAKVMDGFIAAMPAEKRLVWAQKQCYIAMGNALNGAKSLGLDSCPMEGFIPDKFAEVLKLPSNLVPTLVVPVGYANDTPYPKLRFEKKDVFF
ncbi:malonic semialdehyde reductase RutE [uncultured archaeon]|nr:malonic semialdehyde reductase RutE [uncultured archaeon]